MDGGRGEGEGFGDLHGLEDPAQPSFQDPGRGVRPAPTAQRCTGQGQGTPPPRGSTMGPPSALIKDLIMPVCLTPTVTFAEGAGGGVRVVDD